MGRLRTADLERKTDLESEMCYMQHLDELFCEGFQEGFLEEESRKLKTNRSQPGEGR